MCRFNSNHNDECQIEWFDQNDQPLKRFNQTTDLILQNPTFDNSMGFYTCQICCSDQCQRLMSFIYPVSFSFNSYFLKFYLNIFLFLDWRR